MRKLFSLMLLIGLTLGQVNSYCQEEPVKEQKDQEKNERSSTEENGEIKEATDSKEIPTLINSKVSEVENLVDNDEANKAPDIKTFALDPDQMGALANSVNLFTGQVNLPINLISMKGRNGLDVNVSISYSSNVKNIVETWNLEAPTGVLGLGWQFGFSLIVVDHKQTGTREDDEFYLIEGGSSNKLVCYEINTGNRKYKTKNYQFWDITYYNDINAERWEIKKENGIKYIYGDKNSSRQTVQHIVKWGNWIGNTSNGGGEQQVFIWNLSEIINIWNEKIVFHYLDAYRRVLNNTAEYSEASYLSKITDGLNRVIEFWYPNKEEFEYQDPHTEIEELDGYQERYEMKYLDSIVVRNANSSRLFSIHFGYGSFGSGNLYKRQLTSITQKNSNWESLPSLTFTYNTSGNNIAALNEVKLPTGGKVVYTYANQTIGKSNRSLPITAPFGYNEPRVFIADDYVVVTWRSGNHNPGLQNVKVYAYQWLGEWVGGFLKDIGGVYLDDGYQDFNVKLQEDFFTILTNFYDRFRIDGESSELFIFSKDKKERGNWNDIKINSTQNVFKGQLSAGKDYVSILLTKQIWDYMVKDYQALFTRQGDTWVNSTPNAVNGFRILTPDYSWFNSPYRNTMSGINNFLLTHLPSSNPDKLALDYLNEIGNWDQKIFDICETNSNYRSILNASNSFAVLMGSESSEHIYWWSQDYQNLYSSNLSDYEAGSYPLMIENSSFAILKNNSNDDYIEVFRYKGGNSWIGSGNNSALNLSFRNDLILGKVWNWYWRREFNVNTLNWELTSPINGSGNPRAGNNFYVGGGKVQYRLPSGTWQDLGYLNPIDHVFDRTIRCGKDFIIFEQVPDLQQIPFKVCLELIKNCAKSQLQLEDKRIAYQSNLTYIPYDKSELVGTNTFLVYDSEIDEDSFRDITSFELHRVINEDIDGAQQSFIVSKIEVNDGYQTTSTVYHYESPTTNKATIDKTGNIPQFNKVTVVPSGSTSEINYHPYGYTVNYFFNELSSTDANKTFPTGTNTNALSYYMLLTGMLYETNVYDNNDNLKSSVKNYWYVSEKNVNQTKCYYSRLLQKDEMLDNVTKTSEFTYSSSSGLIKTQQTKNYTFAGAEEILKTEIMYGYESTAYDDYLLPLNRLTDVVQTKNLNGSTCIGMSATTLLQFSGVWAPHKSYIKTTTGCTDFNFDLWSGTGEPASDWLKTSEITSVDALGQVLETKDVDGIYTTSHWDKNGLQVASFNNSQYTNKTISDNFDDLSFLDGKPFLWTRAITGWTVNSLGVLSWPNNTDSGPIYISNQQAPTNFIAEFDVRIPDALTTSDWGGFQFRKTSASHGPFTSGYTVFLRKSGRVDLYSATGVILGGYQIPGTNVQLNWQRIRVVASGSSIQIYINGIRRISVTNSSFSGNYTGFNAYRCKAEFDNFIIYPDDAYTSSTAYDPKFSIPIKSIDSKGNSVTYVYDSFQRKIGVVGPTNIPISTGSTFLSLDRYTSFNSIDPNSSLSTTVHGNFGLYNDFSTHITDWTAVPSPVGGHSVSTWTLIDGKLKNNDSGTTTDYSVNLFYKDLGTNLTGRIAIEFSVKTDALNTQDGLGVGLGDNVWDLNANNAPVWGSAAWATFYGASQIGVWHPNGSAVLADWLDAGQYQRIKIVVDVATKKADFFVNGKACLSNFDFIKSTTANIRKISFFNVGRNNGVPTTWYIDDFMVYTEPSHSIVFTDGAGKILQSQSEETSTSIICSETLYDALGRGYVQTMPVRLTSSWLGYNVGFVTSFIDATGVIAGSVLTGSVDNYPYSRTVYELSPLSRQVEQGQPGNELRIGNGHTTRTVFSTNSSNQFPINYPYGQGFVTQSINADGVSAYELKDKLGRTITTKSGPVKGSGTTNSSVGVDESLRTGSFLCNYTDVAQYSFYNPGPWEFRVGTSPGLGNIVSTTASGNSSGSFNVSYGITYYLTLSNAPQRPITPGEIDGIPTASASVIYKNFVTDVDIYPVSTSEYDYYGNLVKIYPPNYYNIPDPTFDKNSYIIEMTYDPIGRLKTKHSSDFNTIRYIYDKAGRLRFSMDGNGENQSTDHIKYLKYDGLGRIIEEGYIVQNWNESTLQNYADTNPSWPTTPATWRKKYTYGIHGTDVYQRGEVTQVEVNNDGNTTAEVTETYSYNAFGDVLTVSTTTSGINQIISYTYNYDGQVATINYGTTTVYYAYDRLGRTSTIGTSSDEDYYASYSYVNYNGLLSQEKLNNNSIIRNFSYNNHGWLTRIDDNQYFMEDIQYHCCGYGGSGYYNGNISYITVADQTIPFYDYYMAFKYDNLGRLEVADITDIMGANLDNYDIGVGTGNETKFDANGNIDFFQGKNYVYYPGTNQIMNYIPNTFNDFEYDANANMISSPHKMMNLTYDSYFDKTSSININWDTYLLLFKYDVKNERASKEIISARETLKTYYYHGLSDYPLAEKNYQGTTLTGTLQYIYGPTGLIAVLEGSSVNYIIKDHLGSTRMVINSGGDRVAKYHYSPYGRTMYAWVNTDVSYKFTGQEFDDENSLYNFRARMYDAELGMFYAYDPAMQGFSPFGYAGNNPVIYVDKDGKFFWLPLAVLAAAGTYGAVKGGIEGGWQGAIYGFSSMTTNAGFAMASVGASIASGGSLGAALMNTGFQSMWTATQGKNLGEMVTSAAETFATSWLASSGHSISDWLGGGYGTLWTKLGTQVGITTTNSIIHNYAVNSPLFENLKVGVGPLVLNVNGSTPVDINLNDNLAEAGAHVLGGLNLLTGGGYDFSWDNLSFSFSGGWYEEFVLRNDLIMEAHGNSLGGVAWIRHDIPINGSTANEEFAHVWQSRFFGGNIKFAIPYVSNYLKGRILGKYNYDAYKDNFYEEEARTFWIR